ncbi:MAG: 16S rRNA (adenine(1518)-N(6)/adenine(1519)-N(6))-dimethyltransferase RsmA [Bacteroidota bacterium]
MVRPKKHLGQHFLTDRNIARRIISLLNADSCDTILEIGPGKGVLTQFLLERKDKNLRFIEIDRESVEYLRSEFPEISHAIIEEDFLKTEIGNFGEKIAIIGNFPYNISSQIFFKILDHRDKVEEIVCMIQKEVAMRLASGPGNKQYGILSVLLQTWYDISIGFHVSPGSFFPPPAVNSTVLRMKRNSRSEIDCNEKEFRKIIKTAFNQRRKMLSNSLKSILVNLDTEIPYLKKRPEELSVDQFIELCRSFEKKN